MVDHWKKQWKKHQILKFDHPKSHSFMVENYKFNNQPERFLMFLPVKSSGALFLISGVIREMSGVSEFFPLSDLDQNRVFTFWRIGSISATTMGHDWCPHSPNH